MVVCVKCSSQTSSCGLKCCSQSARQVTVVWSAVCPRAYTFLHIPDSVIVKEIAMYMVYLAAASFSIFTSYLSGRKLKGPNLPYWCSLQNHDVLLVGLQVGDLKKWQCPSAAVLTIFGWELVSQAYHLNFSLLRWTEAGLPNICLITWVEWPVELSCSTPALHPFFFCSLENEVCWRID